MYRYHLMYRASALEPLDHERYLIQIDRVAAWPAFQSWWSRQRSGFSFDPEFAEIVDERIRRVQSQQA